MWFYRPHSETRGHKGHVLRAAGGHPAVSPPAWAGVRGGSRSARPLVHWQRAERVVRAPRLRGELHERGPSSPGPFRHQTPPLHPGQPSDELGTQRRRFEPHALRAKPAGVRLWPLLLRETRPPPRPPGGAPRGDKGDTTQRHPKSRERDANAGASPRQDGAHPYNVLSITELLVTQAQGVGVKTSPACHDGKADTRDVLIVILISLVIISVIVIVITCFRAQKRRGRVIEREMSNIQSPTSAQVMSPDSDMPVFDFEYQPGLQGGVFPRPSPLQSSLDEEVFTDEHDNVASTLQLYSV
uniref:Uncharacterized protein LOC116951003 n=1 Tax=Petromyzon marinus TaxID=7757 RepID=A0AAJ7X8P8_PETMA|nr:uncharacterized protein LOC116951003 [Petromyzon marinus]